MKKIALLFLLFNLFAQGLIAQKSSLQVGDIAPTFSGTDQQGRHIKLDELLKHTKVVLVFYRGHWCPYCNRELMGLQDSLNFLTDKNVRVIAVSPELPEYVQKTIQKTSVSFSILSDRGHTIMDRYGTTMNLDAASQNRLKTVGVDLSVVNGNNGYVLPVPAVYIINQKGKIDYVFFEPNYRVRPSVKALLAHL